MAVGLDIVARRRLACSVAVAYGILAATLVTALWLPGTAVAARIGDGICRALPGLEARQPGR